MKTIKTRKGEVILVDDEAVDSLGKFTWHIGSNGYPRTYVWDEGRGRDKVVYMHHLIVGKPGKGLVTDHINRQKLDNRRENLRHVPQRTNLINQTVRGGTSRFKGVSLHSQTGKWRSYVNVDGVRYEMGLFDKENHAALARDIMALDIQGDGAVLNFPVELCG